MASLPRNRGEQEDSTEMMKRIAISMAKEMGAFHSAWALAGGPDPRDMQGESLACLLPGEVPSSWRRSIVRGNEAGIETIEALLRSLRDDDI